MAAIAIIISIVLSIVLGAILGDRKKENDKLTEVMKQQQESNLELLKRIPVTNEGEAGKAEPLCLQMD